MNKDFPHQIPRDSHRTPVLPRLGAILAIVVALVGAALALNASFNLMPLFSDEVMLAALTSGVAHHGLGFLTTWSFTSDNYTLDAWPFLAPIYLSFGIGATAVVVSGWLFYVFNAVMLGVILARLVDWRWALGAVAAALSFSGPAVTNVGFLAFTVSHDSTWLLALCGWALFLWRRPVARWQAMLLGIIFCGTISDPWFDAACTLPLVITLWFSDYWRDGSREANRRLLKAVVYTYLVARLAYWLIGEVILGCFAGRNTGLSFQHIGEHAVWVAKDLAALIGAPRHPVAVVITLFVWATILFRVLVKGFSRHVLGPRHATFLILGALSGGGLLMAGLLSAYTTNPMSGRYFINVVYIAMAAGILGLATAYKQRWRLQSLALAAGLAVFVGLGFRSLAGVPLSFKPIGAGDHHLFNALENRRLGVGLGPYFGGVNANTSRSWNGGRRPILPVTINHHGEIAPSYVQASRSWFHPSRGKPDGFLVMPLGPQEAWRKAALRTFGKPRGVFHEGPFLVWVWRQNLLQTIHKDRVANHKAWEHFNVVRNRAAIRKACRTLGVSDQGLQRVYSWLLSHHFAD